MSTTAAPPEAAVTPRAAAGRVAEDVATLAGWDRRATRPGERASAEWIAGRLREIGAADVELLPFRTQSTWFWPHAAHAASAMAAAAIGGCRGRLLAAAALVSYELEVGGRSQWVRRFLPGGVATTVQARIPSAGPRERTLVLAAHHDAAQTGWVWAPAFVESSRRRSAATGEPLPSHAPVALCFAAIAAGPRWLRRAAAAVLGAGVGLFLQSATSATAPGANDNATGVAAVLELATRLAASPLPGVEVILLFPSAEESGGHGSATWRNTRGRYLDPATTFVLNLDALGSGERLVVSRRDGLTGFFGKEDLALVEHAAARAGLDAPQRVTCPNVTDAAILRQAGLRAATVLSYRDGWIKNLHRSADVAEDVEWSTVDDALRLATSFGALWSERR